MTAQPNNDNATVMAEAMNGDDNSKSGGSGNGVVEAALGVAAKGAASGVVVAVAAAAGAVVAAARAVAMVPVAVL